MSNERNVAWKAKKKIIEYFCYYSFGGTFIEECRDVRAAIDERNREVGII